MTAHFQILMPRSEMIRVGWTRINIEKSDVWRSTSKNKMKKEISTYVEYSVVLTQSGSSRHVT